MQFKSNHTVCSELTWQWRLNISNSQFKNSSFGDRAFLSIFFKKYKYILLKSIQSLIELIDVIFRRRNAIRLQRSRSVRVERNLSTWRASKHAKVAAVNSVFSSPSSGRYCPSFPPRCFLHYPSLTPCSRAPAALSSWQQPLGHDGLVSSILLRQGFA